MEDKIEEILEKYASLKFIGNKPDWKFPEPEYLEYFTEEDIVKIVEEIEALIEKTVSDKVNQYWDMFTKYLKKKDKNFYNVKTN